LKMDRHIFAKGKIVHLVFVFCAILMSTSVFAQSDLKSGKVVDATTRQPIAGATVKIVETGVSTSSGSDGTYQITGKSTETLEITLIGYATRRVPLSGNITEIGLQSDEEELEEVVVVGYNVVKKSEVTGAVASIGEKELKAMPVKDAL